MTAAEWTLAIYVGGVVRFLLSTAAIGIWDWLDDDTPVANCGPDPGPVWAHALFWPFWVVLIACLLIGRLREDGDQ